MTIVEVSPTTLHRCAAELRALSDDVRADLTAAGYGGGPDGFANRGWATTAASEVIIAAADTTLSHVGGRTRDSGDALQIAADRYVTTDCRVAGRFARWVAC
jgi:hypothetical protein